LQEVILAVFPNGLASALQNSESFPLRKPDKSISIRHSHRRQRLRIDMGRSRLQPMRRDDPPHGPPTYMRSDLSCDRRHKVPMVMDIIAINCCRQPFAARFPLFGLGLLAS
jgi:hypothetical protein